jgi:methionyl-tRNA synthetase
MKKYYISTAIAYASAKPHIGNTYEIILADAIARFKRLEGYDVYFQTGTDEHGAKIENKAQEANVSPKEYVDKQSNEIQRIWDLVNSSYDNFIRTTDIKHKNQVASIFERLYKQGDIYKGVYEGLYCVPCESFFTEGQLVDGKCPDCGRAVSKASEEAYFFKLGKYAGKLMKHINNNPDFIEPIQRKNEIVNNFLKLGLQDLCVSRSSFKWGIPVNFDTDHVIYVWIDALSNYITFLGYDVAGNHGELYKKYWPADVHVIGKDILRFHAIYWPIMLMALDIPLPKKIFAHPFVLTGEDKMSKSKGNVLYADDLVDVYGLDAVRYYLLHEIPYQQDGIINHELMIERYNSDLANNLGNLVNRTISMNKKYFNKEVNNPKVSTSLDAEFIKYIENQKEKIIENMDNLRVQDAIKGVFQIFERSNKYIDETMPWVLAKEDNQKPRLQTVLYNLEEAIRYGSVLLSAFLPDTAEAIFNQLNTNQRDFSSINQFGCLEENIINNDPKPLFVRIDKDKKLEEIKSQL